MGLASCQNLEKTNDTIPRKHPDRQNDRRMEGWKDEGTDRPYFIGPLLLTTGVYTTEWSKPNWKHKWELSEFSRDSHLQKARQWIWVTNYFRIKRKSLMLKFQLWTKTWFLLHNFFSCILPPWFIVTKIQRLPFSFCCNSSCVLFLSQHSLS